MSCLTVSDQSSTPKKGRSKSSLDQFQSLLFNSLKLCKSTDTFGIEIIDDHRFKKIVVELVGRINKCGVISPRYDLTLDDFEKLEWLALPSRQFGHLVISTNQGIFTHE